MLYTIFNWLLGVLFIVAAVGTVTLSPLASLSLIIASALLLPPVRKFTHSKINASLNPTTRIVLVFLLFMSFGYFTGEAINEKAAQQEAQQKQERERLAAERRQKNIDYFNQHKEEIVTSAKEALAEKDYRKVVSITNKYIYANDADLKAIYIEANTAKLLAELKSIPANQYQQNLSRYKQLASMHPDDKTYSDKVTYYNQKIEQERQAKIAAEQRKARIEKQFSSWDGSHINLERVIKESMNDPDSYEHVKTVYWDRGEYLIVATTFRGKNAFGGVVKNTVKAKVGLDGQVLQILEQY